VWYKFKDCQTVLNDDPQKHRGRPRTSHTDENCVIVEGLIREDRRVKVGEIAEVTTTNTVKREKLREAIERKRPGRLTGGVRLLYRSV
jgi:hypothetical protein